MSDSRKSRNPLRKGGQALITLLQKPRQYLGFRNLNYFFYGLTLFLVFWIPINIDQVQVQEGQVVTRDIVAAETREIIDVQRTEERKQRVLAGLPPVYTIDQYIVDETREDIDRFFDDLIGIRQGDSLSEDFLSGFRARYRMPDQIFSFIISQEPERFEEIRTVFLSSFEQFVAQPVREEDLADLLLEVGLHLEELQLDPEETQIVHYLMTVFLRPNARLDEALTEAEHARILSEVEPVKRIIQKNQVILRQGDIASREHIETLRALGVTGDRFSSVHLALLALIVCFTVLCEFFFIRKFCPELLENDSLLLIRILTIFGIMVIGQIAWSFSWYFIVLGALPLILHSLVGRRYALGECLILIPLLFWADQMDYLRGFSLFINLFLPLLILGPIVKRQDLVRAGFVLSIANVLANCLFGFQEGLGAMTMLTNGLFGAGGGMGAAVMALGGTSLFENTFNLSTDIRLYELMNPTHPLLKRLMMEAPGTYSHSLVVANLAEAAAEEVGANPLLARAGAYYHDIGKLKRPYFFIENQIGLKNIHNRLSPNLSSLIIQNHVKDGVEMAKQSRLPREIREIIARHHGSNLIRYFYDKAVRSRKDPVQEEEFRYSGPHPRSPEEVLIFLADSVEAAIRCMSRPTSSRIETVANNILQTYLKDGQLDESRLTLRDLHTIIRSFVIILSGMVHTRISYPENGGTEKNA